MYANTENWAHRESREPRDYAHSCDSREMIPKTSREYPRTPPTEWKSYTQRRMQYAASMDVDPECLSEAQQRHKQQLEEDEVDEAYWSSVSMLYEKIPSCARPRPVRAPRPLAPQVPFCLYLYSLPLNCLEKSFLVLLTLVLFPLPTASLPLSICVDSPFLDFLHSPNPSMPSPLLFLPGHFSIWWMTGKSTKKRVWKSTWSTSSPTRTSS